MSSADDNPYAAPQTDPTPPEVKVTVVKTAGTGETLLAMQNRHRIEWMNASKPPIGILMQVVLTFFGGLGVGAIFQVIWIPMFLIVYAVIFGFNSLVLRRRLSKLALKQEQELRNREK